MSSIKAIETTYNGHRFRSRLEARWAVFFRTLGVPYEYEPEGFDLGEGIWYLPDFWLPEQNCWAEIKPACEWAYHHECELLAAQHDCGRVLYIAGSPWPGEYGIALYPVGCGLYDSDSPLAFALGRRCDDELWVCHDDLGALCLNPVDLEDDSYPLKDSPR